MHIEDIINQVNQSGIPMDVEFAAGRNNLWGVDDLEGYAVAGMRTRITGGLNERDDTSVLFVDFTPFEEHNRAFETADFWHTDKTGQRVLTDARTAGAYKAQTKLYVPSSIPNEQLFEALDKQALALVEAWKAQNDGTSYVAFLEARVANLQAQLNMKQEQVQGARTKTNSRTDGTQDNITSIQAGQDGAQAPPRGPRR